MDFDKFSKNTIKLIDQEIKKILKNWRKEVGGINKDLLPLVDEFIKGCAGGKRIRGLLVVLGYRIAGSKSDSSPAKPDQNDRTGVKSDIYKIAAAYEIMHTAILVHDDVMDQSKLRRGEPSLYSALGGGRSGESQAICLGDVGFFLATKIIGETDFPDKNKIEALNFFSQIMIDTGVGQILDVLQIDPLTTTELKTARYTISGPLILGAILAGSNQSLIRWLKVFGENLGIAYQIQDDILDSEVKIWGGMDLAREKTKEYNAKALKALPFLTEDQKLRVLLEQLINCLVERKK